MRTHSSADKKASVKSANAPSSSAPTSHPFAVSAAGASSIQAKLTVGAPGDKYEQEADRVAAKVMEMNVLSDPSSPPEKGAQVQAKPVAASISPVVLRKIAPVPLMQSQPTEIQTQSVANESFDADNGLETQLRMSKGGGSPLSADVRSFMEPRFGADFGQVRVHTGANAVQMSRDLNARAFTHGQDVYFGSGHTPGKDALMAHELTHVIQQTGGGSTAAANTSISRAVTDVVQRDIGFEFETKSMATKKANTGALPGGGFASAPAAQTVWHAATSTRVKKGAALLKQADIEVQADDNGTDSDLEVVTTHFPLTANGRTRLDNAMTDLTALVNAYGGLAATAGNIVPAIALNGTAGFNNTMNDGMFLGPWTAATTAPQITFGARVGNIGDIVRDLHGGPNETALEKATRDPGRLRMRRPNPANANEPRNLTVLDESTTLINGNTLARNAIAAHQVQDPTAPGGAELEGLLTIIFTYCEGVRHKMAFLKQHTPLMAKTNLATIFTTLPGPVQTYYSERDNTGESNFEKLIEAAPNYAVKMDNPLFDGVSGIAEDNKTLGQPQWYHKLTLRSWVSGIVLRKRTSGEAFAQFFKDNYGGSKMRPGKDQLTDKAFPKKPKNQEVEGYGALGERMDTDVTVANTPLPVFELRSANRPITYAQAHQWALDLFDYVESLNANPNGGYNHMT